MTDTVYVVSAVAGGTLLVGQFVLGLIGIGADHDLDLHDGDVGSFDHGGSLFFGILSLRAIAAMILFFGLGGIAARMADWNDLPSVVAAIVSGLAAMVAVAATMRMLMSLQDDGSTRIENAKGASGTVYLTIPGQKRGTGKVHLDLQNRTVELQAVTFQDDLPTGTKVIVVDVIGADTVEVVAAPETARVAHA